MNRVFVDLDGVVVDFDAYMKDHGLTGDEVKARPGAYLDMPAIPGAIEAVRSIIGMGFEVWIATKPPTGVPHAYSDKAAWVMKHIPELKRRIIVTHDKGLLGDAGDYLCDDRPHKANCEKFAGTLLRFVDGYHWPQALEHFRGVRAAAKASEKLPRDPAPASNLPDWEECALRVANSDFIAKRVADGGCGADPDTKLATHLHRFIHEYDDASPYRSAWFRHRLELLLAEVKAPYGTPCSIWRTERQPDPHGNRYDCERAALTLGDITDDELANGAFMNYDRKLDIAKVLSGTPDYHPPIVWMTAVKDRIRWLSRRLAEATAKQAGAAGDPA